MSGKAVSKFQEDPPAFTLSEASSPGRWPEAMTQGCGDQGRKAQPELGATSDRILSGPYAFRALRASGPSEARKRAGPGDHGCAQ